MLLQVHDLRPKSCTECDRRFVGAQQLNTHMKSHRKIVCELCLKEVPQNSATDHKYKCKGVTLNCDQCDYETTRPGAF